MTDNSTRPHRVLVVGQTPPPFGGQAIMIRRMLDHDYDGVELRHVRMAFSQEISDAGSFRVRKLVHLASVIVRVAWARARHRTATLYYPPAGPNRVPVLRDLAILISTRWMFRSTIFHFHATNLPSMYPQLSPFMQRLFRAAYWAPDLAIVTSTYNVADAEGVHAQRTEIVPNCLGSSTWRDPTHWRHSGDSCRLLYVGLVTPTKGIDDLLQAGALLRDRGMDPEIVIVGRLISDVYEQHLQDLIANLRLNDLVTFTGELDGPAIESMYESADIFVFPTQARTESFGIVLLEAMSFGLPLVGSGEAGVRSIIRSGVNGFHVASGDVNELAAALETLISDPTLARTMGAAGRELTLTEYGPERFFERIQNALLSVAPSGGH